MSSGSARKMPLRAQEAYSEKVFSSTSSQMRSGSEPETIQTRINDATLRAPVVGRVLYRLAEPGEVLPSGGKALTLVDLSDVYMEIFLPADQAAAVKLGNEARITVDYEPKKSIPGYVSFVSPEAQFTPKQVETKSEREKLMFRVKIQIPRELAAKYIERLKTGIRGVGYVKRNAIAGRRFPSWGAFVAHLERWNREIADQRVHGTTGEPPLARFAAEAGALRPLGGRAPFGQHVPAPGLAQPTGRAGEGLAGFAEADQRHATGG